MKFLAGKRHFSHRYSLHRSVNEQINWEGKGENNAMARTRSAGGRSAICCDRQEREKMCLQWIFTFQFNIYWAPKLGARRCAGYWVFRSLHDKSYTTKELRFWKFTNNLKTRHNVTDSIEVQATCYRRQMSLTWIPSSRAQKLSQRK